VEKRDLLTGREREVLRWVAGGKTSWEISVILRISERTVKFHLVEASRKLNAVNRTSAVAKALARGDEGFVLGMGYSTQRGYGGTHPFAGEIRMGEVSVEIEPAELGFARSA